MRERRMGRKHKIKGEGKKGETEKGGKRRGIGWKGHEKGKRGER